MKIFIGIPVYGNVPLQFLFSLLDFFHAKLSVPYEIKFLQGESLVSRARNKIVADFLASDCTHLLFIDSDILFTVDDIERLIKHKKDIVGGLYAQKCPDKVIWAANSFEGQEIEPDDSGLVNVKYLATGFLMVSRGVFKKMIKECGKEIAYHSDNRATLGRLEHDFFRVGVLGFRYLSEDWYFCQVANDLGYKVWADTNCLVRHWGGAAFPLVQIDAPAMAEKARKAMDSTIKLNDKEKAPVLGAVQISPSPLAAAN